MKNLLLILNLIFLTHINIYCQQPEIELRRIKGQGNGGNILELKPGMYDSIINSPESFYYQPVYQNNFGPFDIKIINAELCPKGLFSISLTGINDTSRWRLYSHSLDSTITGDSTIYSEYLQEIAQWGMQIQTKSTENPGEIINSVNNGFLYSEMFYQDSSIMWLNFVHDHDSYSPLNWIRSGNYIDLSYPEYNDWDLPTHAFDYYEKYENVIGGSWSPYLLTAVYSQDNSGPAYSTESKFLNNFQQLSGIDIIITTDTSNWSRSCVVEMCNDTLLSQGQALHFSYRNHPSVNVKGDTSTTSTNPYYCSNYISPIGMGWFPGYAINVETGERLNIIFGEDSWLASENGRDMLWNPTSEIFSYPTYYPLFGGQHYVYIMGALSVDTFRFPRYDGCSYICGLLEENQKIYKDYIFASTYWVGIPLKTDNHEWLNNDVIIKIRVSKKYNYFMNDEPPEYQFSIENNSSSMMNTTLFSIYPNPVSNKLTILVNDMIIGKEMKLLIFNSQGKQIAKLLLHHIEKRCTLDVIGIREGLYFMEISGDEFNVTQKFIIQR
jgi:hypothetical protein